MMMKRVLSGCLCFVCLLNVVFFASNLLASEKVIVAFGDSTTASRGQLRVYSDLLQGEFRSRKIDAKVFNAGVGGNTTQRAGVRFEADVLSRKPDVTIIQFGINDSAVDVWRSPPSVKPRIGVDQYERNLRLFIQKLESQGSEIILMTPNSLRWTPKLKQLYGKSPYLPDEPGGFNVLLKKYAEVVRQVGKEQSVPVVDVFAAFEKYGKVAGQNVDDLLLDGMHPNEKGQQLVFDLLKKSQSLKSLLLSPSVR